MRERPDALPVRAFRHELFEYTDPGAYADRLGDFLRQGLAAGERVVAAVPPERIEPLRTELATDADRVLFLDMAELGRNPARIIPEWHRLATAAVTARVRLRGVDESLWPGRDTQETVECHIHEWLLPAAFAVGPALTLLCPYDAARMSAGDLEAARLLHSGTTRLPFDATLPGPPAEFLLDGEFTADDLATVRDRVAVVAVGAGLEAYRAKELTLAVHEIATNSVRHGGGGGRLRVWWDGAVICEVADAGHITDPLVGRRVPMPGDDGGRGVWLANQLCDLVQIRTSPAGTVVRLRMTTDRG